MHLEQARRCRGKLKGGLGVAAEGRVGVSGPRPSPRQVGGLALWGLEEGRLELLRLER